MGKRWYVIQAKPTQEEYAVKNLEAQSFKVFYPKFVHHYKDKKTGRYKETIKALFPSYLFVCFDIKRHKRWKSIQGTRGVLSIIGYTEAYVSALPQGCVEELLSKADKKGIVSFAPAIKAMYAYTKGEEVLIKNGNFDGILATYESSKQGAATLLLSLLGKPTRVIMPIEAIVPAKLR